MRYLILILFLISCDSEKKKSNKAIENCSDYNYLTDLEFNNLSEKFSKLIYSDSIYISASSDILNFDKEVKKIESSISQIMSEWDSKNPLPKDTMSRSQSLATQNYKKVWEQQDKYYAKRSEFYNTLKKERLNPIYKEIKIRQDLRQKVVKSISDREIRKMDLSTKANLENYTTIFAKCEKAFNETPKSFVLEWERTNEKFN